MIIGGYVLHVYCENSGLFGDCTRTCKAGFPGPQIEFAGSSKDEAYRRSRQYGWSIHGKRAVCPECDKYTRSGYISNEEINECRRIGREASKKEREIMRQMTTPTAADLAMRFR